MGPSKYIVIETAKFFASHRGPADDTATAIFSSNVSPGANGR